MFALGVRFSRVSVSGALLLLGTTSGLANAASCDAIACQTTTQANVLIDDGNTLNIGTGGVLRDSTVNHGSVAIWDWGQSVGTTVNGNETQLGWLMVNDAGSAQDSVLNGGQMVLLDSATALGTTVNDGFIDVTHNAVVSNTRLNSGGMFVYMDGKAENTSVDHSELNVYQRGFAQLTTVNNGGVLSVNESASAIDTIVNQGGRMESVAGTHVHFSTINQGGLMVLGAGADASDTTLNSGGVLQIKGDAILGGSNHIDGQVRFADPAINGFHTLTIKGPLTGNGSFLMNTDLAALQGDLIEVLGPVSDTPTLVVADSGRSPAGPQQPLMLVNGSGGSGGFKLFGQTIDVGAYRYQLQQQGNDWYLANLAVIDPVTPPVEPPVEPPVLPPVEPPVLPPVEPPVQPPVLPPVEPPAQPPVLPPVEPPAQPPVLPPVEPPAQPPVLPPVEPPAQPPVLPPVEPPAQPPVLPPVEPPAQPPVLPPVEPPAQPPVLPPVEPPVQPPVTPPVEPPAQPPVQPPVEPVFPVDPAEPVSPVQPPRLPQPEVLSKGANAAIASQIAATALISAQMHATTGHFGDLRSGKDKGGLWTRGYGAEQRLDTDTSRALQQQVNGMEIGADKALPLADGTLYVGGLFGQGQGRQDFGEASKGKIDSLSVGAYASYLDHSGLYLDGALKYSRLDNDIDITSNLGEPVKAHYKTHAVSADVQIGQSIGLGQGWFVEPQAGLQMASVSGGSYTASNGLDVEQDSIKSLQSRVGGLFGRDVQLDNGIAIRPYAKAAWITEHAGEGHVKVNGAKLDSRLPGSRAEIGGGMKVSMAQQHNLFVEAGYTKGSEIEQPWAATVGYRYNW
ncbi:autotransporter outer membrane beta-barrel domain-containing protein [Pseudomonas sp. 18173]|uniref:autotransporter outer membrane beta-barrel domain-containing protein n=1 Tax=Pseudomonas sp. 18173 TaxID=3390055 RepID=UPI003D1F5DEC